MWNYNIYNTQVGPRMFKGDLLWFYNDNRRLVGEGMASDATAASEAVNDARGRFPDIESCWRYSGGKLKKVSS